MCDLYRDSPCAWEEHANTIKFEWRLLKDQNQRNKKNRTFPRKLFTYMKYENL